MPMKKLLTILVLALAGSAYSQSSLPEGPKVNGIALGAKYADVVRTLGRPTREVTSRTADECTGSRTRTLQFPGLKVELFDEVRNVYTVFSFEVTSPKWDVSGTKVGDTSASIQKLFGTRGRNVAKEGAETVWYYEMSEAAPGTSNFHFRGGKLTKIVFGYTMC